MSQSYTHLPLATERDLRTRRRQGSREDQQGSDEREGAVFRDTASLVTTTGSSRLPANPALECFKMRWTLEISGPGKCAIWRHVGRHRRPPAPSRDCGPRTSGTETNHHLSSMPDACCDPAG